jgi:hypothetical protein
MHQALEDALCSVGVLTRPHAVAIRGGYTKTLILPPRRNAEDGVGLSVRSQGLDRVRVQR